MLKHNTPDSNYFYPLDKWKVRPILKGGIQGLFSPILVK